MDEFLKKQLTNDQARNFAMNELVRNSAEIAENEKKRKSLESRRMQLILKCRSFGVSLATIGNLAGVSRQRVTQIIERHTVSKRAFENDALIPKEESESYLMEHDPEEVARAIERLSALNLDELEGSE